MKKLFTLIAALLFAATVWAQSSSPKMSYQAVVRNAANELVVNRTDLTVEVSIKQGDTVAYKETHTNVKTNQNGLLSLLIGDGNVNKGSLNDVDWKNAKIATSINLGEGEPVSATVPVTAVPYALYAESVNPNSEIITEIQGDINNIKENYLTIDGLCDSIKNKCGEFATKTDVKAAADTLASKNSLNDYTTTAELCGYITSNCTDLTTDAELKDTLKAYYDTTAIKNKLGDYATKTDVKAAADTLASKSSLNDYTKTTELCDYITSSCTDLTKDAELKDTLKAYYDTTAIKNKLNDYATKTDVQTAVDTLVSESALTTTLAEYYTKTETYSQSEINTKFESYYTSTKIDDTLANYALISQEKALTFNPLTSADSAKLLADTTLTIPTGSVLDTCHLVKLYINGVYVGDNADGVLVVTDKKKVRYDYTKNGDYKLAVGDRIKILYWVKNN